MFLISLSTGWPAHSFSVAPSSPTYCSATRSTQKWLLPPSWSLLVCSIPSDCCPTRFRPSFKYSPPSKGSRGSWMPRRSRPSTSGIARMGKRKNLLWRFKGVISIMQLRRKRRRTMTGIQKERRQNKRNTQSRKLRKVQMWRNSQKYQNKRFNQINRTSLLKNTYECSRI